MESRIVIYQDMETRENFQVTEFYPENGKAVINGETWEEVQYIAVFQKFYKIQQKGLKPEILKRYCTKIEGIII